MCVLWQSFAKSQQFGSIHKPNKCWEQHVDAVDNFCIVLSVLGESCQYSSVCRVKLLTSSVRNPLFLSHTMSSVLFKTQGGKGQAEM